MSAIINALACQTWLRLLQSSTAKPLVGNINKDLFQIASMYDITPAFMDYGAEVPLLGPASVDLSAQYCIADFLYNNPLTHPRVQALGEFIHNYGVDLERLLPKVIPDCYCFLETDTGSGDSSKTALFLNMAGAAVDRLLPKVMESQGFINRLGSVQGCLQLIEQKVSLWHIGFMYSRQEEPIRLVLLPRSGNGEDLIWALNKLGKSQAAEQMQEIMFAMEKTQLFSFILDIDIMPDGSLGNTFGLEIILKMVTPAKQQMMFATPAWREATRYLLTLGNVDERIKLIDKCVFAKTIHDQLQKSYYMYSRLSHFKARWHSGEQLPTKAYFQLRNRELQNNLNEVFCVASY